MIIGQVKYNIYDWSKKATALSIGGAIFKGISLVCFLGTILLFINLYSHNNGTIKDGIIILLGIISLIVGISLNKFANSIANKTFKEKISSDLMFARTMGRKMPELKQNFMELNSKYAELVNSGRDESESFQSIEKKRPLSKEQYLVLISVLLILGLIIAFLSEHHYI